ncbi:MAG: endopeptidase La [bacterium]
MFRIERDQEIIEIHERLPLLPLRDVVVFPYMIVPILVGRESSMKALQEAMIKDRLIFLCAQKNPAVEGPTKRGLHGVGVVARVLQVLRLPNGMLKVLIEGLARAKVVQFYRKGEVGFIRLVLKERKVPETPELQARTKVLLTQFNEYVKLNSQIPDEVLFSINTIENPQQLADVISAQIVQKMDVKQKILEAADLNTQLRELSRLLSSEMEILHIEKKIDDEVRSRMQKTQREFYLHEQMKAIREELGEADDQSAEIAQLKKQIEKADMPKEVKRKALSEMEKLRKMHLMSPESTVVRNYLDWLIALPWSVRTKDNLKIDQVQKILDDDHYGLEKPKERIVEYLAVIRLSKKIKGPILCFVGPPGVGKTSLGRSIARALGRKFVRVSLGGIRDEAEIRGHRRTYIGSMPGRIIQSMKRARTKNPVFLLDEVDKMSVDFRGDPSAALLEVLDPEQNCAFSDHYLDVDYDLSEVMFITTANVRHNIPPPLLDRMEVIELPGYLEHEKVGIAEGFLIPKQRKEHGLKPSNLKISEKALVKIIRNYTQEAGVRNLEREIAAICRKVAKQVVAEGRKLSVAVTANNLHVYLGPPRFLDKRTEGADGIGVATGLAWTEVGGDILNVEVTLMEGKGKLILTGQLGEVMQESAQAALSYTRARASTLGIAADFYKRTDVHIHVPEGAIPKDGPSAGVTMATALISALTKRPVRRDVALTGEITLRGRVLSVGGLNEKCLAALRAGVKTVVMPKENEKDYKELPVQLRRGLEFSLVETMDEVVEIALLGPRGQGRAGGAEQTEAQRARDTEGATVHSRAETYAGEAESDRSLAPTAKPQQGWPTTWRPSLGSSMNSPRPSSLGTASRPWL